MNVHTKPHPDPDNVSEVYEEIPEIEPPRFERVYWTREPHLRKLYGMTFFLMVASATTGYDSMLLNTSQQIHAWNHFFFPETKINPDLNDPVEDSKLAILINMFNIGSIFSFFITPYFADNYGRRPSIVAGCIFMIFGGLLTGFCNGYGMYMGGRFLLGFGNSLAQMASPLLLTEIVHPQHRGPVTAIYNCLWNAGALLVSCIAWGTSNINNDWSWRSITLLQVLPSAVQLAGIWGLPESPRFLINKERHDEALDILAKWHAGGDRLNRTVQFEFREIKETIRIQKQLDESSSYADFVRTKGNRWRLAIIISLGVISQYSGNALFSNYMNAIYGGAGITEQSQKLAISTGKIILDLIVTIFAALNVDRFGRRPLFLISTCGMVVSFACWTATGAVYEYSNETNMTSGYTQLVFIWIFGIFYDIGFSGLLVAYALEVLPFHLRAKGMMLMNITVQAVLAISKLVSFFISSSAPLAFSHIATSFL
ncbi:MFS general substrate transporter [Sordaria brevicollis]|uniref:MFS general substrate transporter n=1 Tax=Sordaria brevicollis TaxID=83679 RepID=A0AAE0PM50_SORBR|nr:MFS general substrate transporter [Sordaria brevicollis]